MFDLTRLKELVAQPHPISIHVELLKGSERLTITIYRDELCMWYEQYGMCSEHTPYSFQYAYAKHTDIENSWLYILEAVEKYRQGLIQCSYCGKWIPIKEAHQVCPAGCSCDDCYNEARIGEREFLSQLD